MSRAHRRQHPVYLLRDRAGIYGLGCAIEWGKPSQLILRPDLIQASPDLPDVKIKTDLVHGNGYCSTALQPIHGSMNLRCLVEEEFRRIIFRELLRRRGLDYFNCDRPSKGDGWNWWARDPAKQARNRKIYHATKGSSFAIVNDLIRKALTAAADPAALKLARRFHVNNRYHIYCAAICSPRAAQLAEIFPRLAIAIYSDREDKPRREEAARLVEAGAPLRHIAELMGVPMALRRVPPGAASLAHNGVSEICACNPKLFETYLPKTLPQARLWLRAIADASYRCDDENQELVEWTARHCLEIPGKQYDVLNALSDIWDWARDEATVRPFCPSMSLQTVSQLSAKWHETIADAKASPDYKFPQPWCAPGQAHGYEILPITSSVELYREGRAMHHCAATYAGSIAHGGSYFYSIRRQGERVATVELHRLHEWPARDKYKLVIGQMRGPCNATVSPSVKRAVCAWLKESPSASPLF